MTAGEYEVFSQANENVLKVNFVDACTMLCLYSKPQNGTLWGGGVHCMLCELYLNKLFKNQTKILQPGGNVKD